MATNHYDQISREPKLAMANNKDFSEAILAAFERMHQAGTDIYTIQGRMMLLDEMEARGLGIGMRSKKTASMTLDTVKDSSGWYELGHELGLSEQQIVQTFEGGEYGSVRIVVDDKLNVVGGRIIPKGR